MRPQHWAVYNPSTSGLHWRRETRESISQGSDANYDTDLFTYIHFCHAHLSSTASRNLDLECSG